MRESELAKMCFRIWANLGTGRNPDEVRKYLKASSYVGKVPSRATLYTWKSHFKWDERLKKVQEEGMVTEEVPIFVDPLEEEWDIKMPEKQFNIIVSHREGFQEFNDAAKANLPKAIKAYTKKLEKATERLEIPDVVQINQYEKWVRTFKNYVEAMRCLHDLTAEVAGLDVLVEEKLS